MNQSRLSHTQTGGFVFCSQTGGSIWVQGDKWVVNDTYANNYDVMLAVLASQTGGSIQVQGDERVVNDTYANNYDVMLAV